MYVFRIEIPIGPYTYGPFTACTMDRRLTHLKHHYTRAIRAVREPIDDGCGRNPYPQEVVGSPDLFMLLSHWMPNRRVWKRLYEAGFRLQCYEVAEHHVTMGHTQCLWDPHQAHLVATLDLRVV